MAKNVLVNGANGRMGQTAVTAIENDPNLNLVGAIGKQDNLQKSISTLKPDVVVDLTTAHSVYENTKIIIDANCHPVIGTSGLTIEQLQQLQQTCVEKKLGGAVIPNFSIGAVLMMNMAAQAAKFFSYVEIVEQHHEKKIDAPSGTAIKTADVIKQARQAEPNYPDCKEILAGSRGATQEGIHIHAVRLPGLVAKQQVIFGGNSETLTIEHNSIDRQSFMPGLLLACKQVSQLKELIYGLDRLLGL